MHCFPWSVKTFERDKHYAGLIPTSCRLIQAHSGPQPAIKTRKSDIRATLYLRSISRKNWGLNGHMWPKRANRNHNHKPDVSFK